jgi:hypothetical protein
MREQSVDQHFAEEYVRPVEDILGKATLTMVNTFDRAEAMLLQRQKEPVRNGIADCRVLTAPRSLNDSQQSELRRILLDPASYWNGHPIYRRFPPSPNFAFRLHAENVLEVLVDLHNPGWKWFCGEETYWEFHFAGDCIAALAKQLFPEIASASPSAIWRQGAIHQLEQQATR